MRADIVNVAYLEIPGTDLLQVRVLDAMAAHKGNVYLMYITRTDFYPELVKRLDKTLKPVHEIIVDGGSILKIMLIKDQNRLLWK